MKTRALGRTGIEVTELGLGTWGLSGEAYGPVTSEEARKVIGRAAALGITLFETASSYARGDMEKALGEVLASHPGSVVATKLGTNRDVDPPEKCFEPDYLRRTAQTSRERLGAGVRVIALLHNPTRGTIEAGKATDTLRALTAEGILDSWGVSGSDEPVIEAALRLEAPLVSVPYNIVRVQPLRALSERIRQSGTGVLVHSVLAYGLLNGRWGPWRTFGPKDHRRERFPDGLQKKVRYLDAVRPLVSGDVDSTRSAAVRFALTPDVVSSVILGPRNALQLDQLVRDGNVEPPYLTPAKLESLEGRLVTLGVPR